MATRMNELKQSGAGQTPAIGSPEQIIVAAAKPTHAESLMGLLKAAGLREQYQAGTTTSARPQLINHRCDESFKTLHKRLESHPDAHLMIAVSLPALAIAAHLENGTSPEEALSEWHASTLILLQLVRLNRRRISLVFTEAAMAAPKAFLEALAHRLQVELAPRQLETQQPELPGSLWRLIADYAMQSSMDARTLVAELEATALPIPAPEYSGLPPMDRVVSEYQTSVETPTRLAGKLKEEKDLLLQQLQQVKEELQIVSRHGQSEAERYERALEETRQQLERSARQQIIKVKKTLDESQRQVTQEKSQRLVSEKQRTALIKRLQEENELLLQQLHHVQDELETNYLRNQQEELAREESQQQLQAAHQTILAIYSSYSWRISRPLRWIQYLLGGGRRPAVDKVPLPATEDDAQEIIEALYQSKSWKVTKPLRFVFGLFVRNNKD